MNLQNCIDYHNQCNSYSIGIDKQLGKQHSSDSLKKISSDLLKVSSNLENMKGQLKSNPNYIKDINARKLADSTEKLIAYVQYVQKKATDLLFTQGLAKEMPVAPVRLLEVTMGNRIDRVNGNAETIGGNVTVIVPNGSNKITELSIYREALESMKKKLVGDFEKLNKSLPLLHPDVKNDLIRRVVNKAESINALTKEIDSRGKNILGIDDVLRRAKTAFTTGNEVLGKLYETNSKARLASLRSKK